jgi:hypothetical protein
LTAARTWGLVGAVLGPLLVFGCAWRSLTRSEPWKPEGVVADMDALAKRGPADVVVIGSSFVRTDVNPELLGVALGPKPLQVKAFSQNLTPAPVWYAILKERVYGNDLHPAVVVIVATMESLITSHVPDARLADITQHMPEPDAVLMAKTWSSTLPYNVQKALERRATLRDPVVGAFRDAPVELLFPEDGVPPEKVTEKAGKVVFGEQHAASQARTLPVVEMASKEGGAFGTTATSVDDTYVADIAALAAEHGARVVIVLPPTSSHQDAGQRVDSRMESAVIALCNRLGVGWVDLRGMAFADTDYLDGRHLALNGRDVFTKAMAEKMVAIGMMSGGAITPATSLVSPTSVTRTGTPPTIEPVRIDPGNKPCLVLARLPDLAGLSWSVLEPTGAFLRSPVTVQEGDTPLRSPWPVDYRVDCAGTYDHPNGTLLVWRHAADGPPLRFGVSPDFPITQSGWPDQYWIYPGTTGTWQFDAPWTPPTGAFAVEAWGFGVGKGTAAAELRVGDRAVPFTQIGKRLVAKAAVDALSGPWSITVTSPPDGPWLALRGLRLVAGDDVADVVEAPKPKDIDLFADAKVEGGTVPAFVPGAIATDAASGRSWFEGAWENQAGCSPLLVSEDGAPLARPKQDQFHLKYSMLSGIEHLGDRLYFVVPDKTDPTTNGRRYTATTDPTRKCWVSPCERCATRWWLYPGDALRAEVPNTRRWPLGAALQKIELRAAWNTTPPDGATVHVRVTVGDQVEVDADVLVADLAGGAQLELGKPIIDGNHAMMVVEIVGGPGLPPLLLTGYGLNG